MSENQLRCSFCGKDEGEVHQLIAGPHVYICDGCVATCNEILSSTQDQPMATPCSPDSVEHQAQIQHYLARAKSEIDGARLLVYGGQLRLGVMAARESARSAVRALELVRGTHGPHPAIESVLRAAIADDPELRRLDRQKVATCILQPFFTRDADSDDAENAVATATGIVAYVTRQLNGA